MKSENIIYLEDCRYFRGDIPCRPHKTESVHCNDCSYYSKIAKRILIIKLGAIGDVIRTTPLLHKIKADYPDAAIWWLTYSPDVVPSIVDKVLNFNLESILMLEETKFDILINLDKDTQACALTNRIEADAIYGFVLKDGKPAPANELSVPKFLTGLFDDVNKANEKSYLEEIFEICGWKFSGEEYILETDNTIQWTIESGGKKIVGLNTGCGDRWISRLLPDDYWVELIEMLIGGGYYPLLLGGRQEHEKNTMLSEKTGAAYLGHFSLPVFISLVNQCDAVVSAVTMGMHIAIALKKPLILMNNIFNPKEFELYGRGEIVQPDKECKCFFSPKCRNEDYFCMESLYPHIIYNALVRSLTE